MRFLERVPAVRRIETDRSNVFAIAVSGEFIAADAENLFGMLEGAFSLHDRIDLVVRLTELDSVELSDLDDATIVTMRTQVNAHVTRCAIIGTTSRAARVARLFSASGDAQLRRFADNEEEQAWAWIDAHEIG